VTSGEHSVYSVSLNSNAERARLPEVLWRIMKIPNLNFKQKVKIGEGASKPITTSVSMILQEKFRQTFVLNLKLYVL